MAGLRLATLVAAACLVSAGASATKLTCTANLKGSAEVPPTDSKGLGAVDATLDTSDNLLIYTIQYNGLTGSAVAAHFHGPAGPGENAKPVVPMQAPLTSPIQGRAQLNAQQAAELQQGKWYFNIHTKAHPGGEIRGQVACK